MLIGSLDILAQCLVAW